MKKIIVRRVPVIVLLFLCSACCLPTPLISSEEATMQIDPALTNTQVASTVRIAIKDLYELLSTPEWQHCTGYPQRAYDAKCSQMFNDYRFLAYDWTGKITEYDEDNAIVEIDHYSNLPYNVVTYGGRFERLDEHTLEIRVRSVGPYCSRMADAKAAEAWKNYLQPRFSALQRETR